MTSEQPEIGSNPDIQSQVVSINGPLKVRFMHNPEAHKWQWVLENTLEYRVGDEFSNRVLRILPGARTDFASVPPIARVLVPTWSHGHALSATIHDALYRGTDFEYVELVPGSDPNQPATEKPLPRPTKEEADDIYREANRVIASFRDGLAWWQRILAYQAVKWFGGSSYKKAT